MSIQATRLNKYMENFFGYGNLKSPWWFIGIEERSSGRESEINARLDVWENLGSPTTCDVADFHIRLSAILNERSEHFPSPNLPDSCVKIQNTWRRLMEIFFSANNTQSDLKSYQRNKLARMGNDNEIALLELFPLPKPGIGSWPPPYSDCVIPPQPNLRDRETYYTWAAAWRPDAIRKLIESYSPTVVVFYGRTASQTWKGNPCFNGQPAQFACAKTSSGQCFETAKVKNSLFVIIPHPANRYHGLRKTDWGEIAKFIKNAL
jgi:hypothetical protein